MYRQEWNQFVEDLYNAEISQRLRVHRRRHHLDFEEHQYRLERLIEASRAVRLAIEIACREGDANEALQPTYLNQALADIRRAAELFNQRELVDTGIAEVLEPFIPEIMSGLEIEDLPKEDLLALRRAGVSFPEEELRLRIRLIRSEWPVRQRNDNRPSIRHAIHLADAELEQAINEIEPTSEPQPPRKKVRWWKALGSLCRGTVLTGVDLALLTGGWALPLSPDTTIVGGVASIATGLGDIAIGVGEFRDE